MKRRSASYVGAFSKNGLSQLGESDETRLAVQMAAPWNDIQRSVQMVGYVLRARQRNIGIVIPRPATYPPGEGRLGVSRLPP